MDMGVLGLSFPDNSKPKPIFIAGVEQGVFDQARFLHYNLINKAIFSPFSPLTSQIADQPELA
jgi:hypothetical protein